MRLTGWPYPDASLLTPSLQVPAGFGTKRVFIDAGHGAAHNTGPPSVFCEREEDFDLRVANDLGARLRRMGAFEVRLSRNGLHRPSYQARVKAALAWRADVILSIHFDVRGTAQPWAPTPGSLCYRNDGDVGFAVLYADSAEPKLVQRRSLVARSLSLRMAAAGFRAYDGSNYMGIYDADPIVAGAYIDRHPPGQRIFLLNHTPVPTVIIETHHGGSLPEASRWREESTLRAFAAAVAAGLADALATPDGG